MRALYVLGIAYIVWCSIVLGEHFALTQKQPVLTGHVPAFLPSGTTGANWFAQARPFCNPVEVEMHLSQNPPPQTAEGAGYSAACLVLAGQIDRARSILQSMGKDDRIQAAKIVFEIGHSVADSGDDKSAGPIMRLVLEFDPDNPMALYHAGMSEYVLGEFDSSKAHLRRFVVVYTIDDTTRSEALDMLSRLGS